MVQAAVAGLKGGNEPVEAACHGWIASGFKTCFVKVDILFMCLLHIKSCDSELVKLSFEKLFEIMIFLYVSLEDFY